MDEVTGDNAATHRSVRGRIDRAASTFVQLSLRLGVFLIAAVFLGTFVWQRAFIQVTGKKSAAVGQNTGESEMSAYQQLTDFFERESIRHQVDDQQQAVTSHITGTTASYLLVARVESNGLLQIWGQVPFKVPAGARLAVAEALCHANWGLKIGSFQMNWSDGDLVFHATSIYSDDAIPDKMIGQLMFVTLTTLDRYVPAIMSIVYANEEPERAVNLVEQTG